MKLLHEQVMGAVVIAGLVAAGLFIADEHEIPRWLSGRFLPKSEQLSEVTVSNVEWSADGTTLLCQSRGGQNALSTLSVHDIRNASSHSPAWTSAVAGGISHSSFSPDGSSVVVATHAGELWWIDLETAAATELARTPQRSPFLATAIGHDGRFMAGGAENGEVHLCDPTRGDATVLKSSRKSPVTRLRFSNDSQRLLGTRSDGSMSVWETISRKLIEEFGGRESLPKIAAFLPDNNHVLASAGGNSLQILNVDKGSRVWQGGRGTSNVGHLGIVTLDVSSKGNVAAWGDALSKRIVIWDLERHQKIFEIDNPSSIIHLKFSPDGARLAVAGRESIVRVYDLRSGIELHKIDVGRTA